MQKLKAFEYLTIRLSEWYKTANGSLENNDLNKLKILKLLFFVSAVDADENNDGLLNTFNNYYAMPYGHVESDIYDNLAKLSAVRIDRNGLAVLEGIQSSYFDDITSLKSQIDLSIEKLKSINSILINYRALDLVELSHLWYSWRLFFNLAQSEGSLSKKIPTEIIKSENKFYFLK